MGKSALIAIAAFTVMGAIYTLSSSSTVIETSGVISLHNHEILARNAAVTGFEDAKLRLAKNFASTSFYGPYESSFYNVSASVSGSTVKVTSVGQALPIEGGAKTFNIVAELEQESIGVTADEPPPFMQYALMSNGDLALGGSLSLDTVKVEGSDITEQNANVHTNGKLTSSGNKLKVKGFGTFRTTQNVTHETVFTPHSNPARDNVIKKVTKNVEMPSFDSVVLAAQLQAKGELDAETIGNLTLSGTYDFEALGATRENPYIWHVTGNVTTNGNLSMTGYVIFLVDGNATFNGNLSTGERTGKSENTVAMYTNGDLEIGGSATDLWMQTYARNNVSLNGNAKVYGNVSAGNTVSTTGSPTIKYFPASPALANVFHDPITRLRLVAYREY